MSRRSSSYCLRKRLFRPPTMARRRLRPRAVRTRLHAGPCRAPAAPRADRVLGGGRHAGDHGALDHHHRHLFRLPRRRADADSSRGRPTCNSATRIASPSCARRSTASRAASFSTRSSTSRSSSRSCGGSRRWSSAPPPSMGWPIRRPPARSSSPRAAAAAAMARAARRSSRRRSTTPPSSGQRPTARPQRLGMDGALARVAASLDRVEQRQIDGAQFDGRDLRRQGAAHPRRARRPRSRPRQDRSRECRRHRRPVRAGAGADPR